MVSRINRTKIMHRAVISNGIVFLGGVIADDKVPSMGHQTRQICKKLDEYLAQAGSDRTKVISAQIYLTDMSGKDEMNEAWLEWLDAAHLPARATVGVADLGTPDTLIEVVVTAEVA